MALEQINRIMEQNALITLAYSRYINFTPRFITADMVADLARECDTDPDAAYRLLLSAAMGLDTVDDPEHRRLERLYVTPGVKRLDPAVYRRDAYFQTVQLPTRAKGRWETLTATYAAYEPFVWNDPLVLPDLREIPQIGYFAEDFHFPAIHQDGVEWMSVKPNEVETMKAPIRAARGRVLTLGLGLGYYAFHAAQKPEVESVTVIERDAEAISLFREWILPQFPHGEKIHIVHADAFDYLEQQAPSQRFDTVFADLWHDPSDGLELYLRLKKLEKNLPGAQIDYWIETTLLSALRRIVYEKLTSKENPTVISPTTLAQCLSEEFLKQLDPQTGR